MYYIKKGSSYIICKKIKMNENEFNNLDLLQWFVNLCHVNNNNNVKNNNC